MQVRYNFDLKSDYDDRYEPWLQDIFNYIEDNGVNYFVIRVTREHKSRVVKFRFDNKKNKTYVVIYKSKETLRMKAYVRELPTQAKDIKVKDVEIGTFVSTFDEKGKIEIAKLALGVLDEHNDYSLYAVAKRNFTTNYDDDCEYTGGIITDVMDCDDNQIIVTNKGESFLLPTSLTSKKRVIPGKFIIVDKQLNFDTFFQSELSLYYTELT
jgi:hypothetical protein